MTPDEPVDLPRGIYEGRLDDKGRLRLPAAFQEYLRRTGVKEVFVTSLDRRTGRIYPLQAWRDAERVLREQSEEDPAKSVTFNATDLGAQVEIDSLGRIFVPAELRRAVGIGNSKVWMLA